MTFSILYCNCCSIKQRRFIFHTTDVVSSPAAAPSVFSPVPALLLCFCSFTNVAWVISPLIPFPLTFSKSSLIQAAHSFYTQSNPQWLLLLQTGPKLTSQKENPFITTFFISVTACPHIWGLPWLGSAQQDFLLFFRCDLLICSSSAGLDHSSVCSDVSLRLWLERCSEPWKSIHCSLLGCNYPQTRMQRSLTMHENASLVRVDVHHL